MRMRRETVSNAIREVHRYGDCSALGFILVKAGESETTVAEIGRRAEEAECLDRFEAVLGGVRSQSLHDSREKDPLLDLRYWAEDRDAPHQRLGGRSGPVLEASPLSVMV